MNGIMSGLLPEETTTDTRDVDPEVVGLEETETDTIFSVLSSKTARSILAALYESPATQSELADRVETSIQNVNYHIENLTAGNLVTVVDQVYSEKGKQMDVFGPTNGPLVVVSGDTEQAEQARNAVGLLERSRSTAARGD